MDSKFSHLQWRNIPTNKGGIGKVSFPLVSDLTKSISRKYGVLFEEAIALRATFIIDTNFKVRHQSVNDLTIGRNIEEIIRIIDAIHYVEAHGGEVCPAEWKQGTDAMEATQEGVQDYLTSHSDNLP